MAFGILIILLIFLFAFTFAILGKGEYEPASIVPQLAHFAPFQD